MSDSPRCVTCSHSEDDHDGYGGMCDGLGYNESRTVCGCQQFVAPALSEGEPTPAPEYTVRACRGHYHVQLEMGNGDTEDMVVRGDPFKTREEAEAIADKRNAGISWEEIESPVSPSLSTSSPEPDIREMLYEYAHCVVSNYYAVTEKMADVETRENDVAKARSAIELSFATLPEEIKRLKLWIPDCDVCGYPFAEHDRKNGYCFHGGIGEDATSYEPKPSEELAHAIRTLRSENERLRLDKTGLEQWKELAQKDLRGLRATALTPEEASAVLDALEHGKIGMDRMQWWFDAKAKLEASRRRSLLGETPK